MADRQLPAVPIPAAGAGSGAPGTRVSPVGESATEGGRAGPAPGSPGPSDADARHGRPMRLLGGVVLLAAGLILALGLASLLGDPIRDAVLVQVDRSPVGSQPSYSDAPREAATFFARRDTVRVRVPRDMTVSEFLGLYHLETNAAARAALRDQLGAVADGDLLREGDRVTITVTVSREAP